MNRKGVLLLVVMLAGLVLATGPAAADPVRVGLVYSRDQATALAQGHDPLLSYRRAVEEAGGTVLALAVPRPEDDPRGLLTSLDALLLPGGGDVDPSLYGQRPTPWLEGLDRPLDDWEKVVVQTFVKTRRPILGICRGHQIMNVLRGGTLYQDLPRQRGLRAGVVHRADAGGGRTKVALHRIHIRRGTLLHSLLGVDSVVTNSRHHQAVRRLAPGLRVTATSNDGVVEALEGSRGLTLLAVQFHPERMRQEDARFRRLFTWLVRSGETWKRSRHPAPR